MRLRPYLPTASGLAIEVWSTCDATTFSSINRAHEVVRNQTLARQAAMTAGIRVNVDCLAACGGGRGRRSVACEHDRPDMGATNRISRACRRGVEAREVVEPDNLGTVTT